MADDFYAEMQEMATELLTEFKQGTVILRRISKVSNPETPWIKPVETPTDYPLNAIVKRMHQRYENGALIVETGDMVTFAVPAVEPLNTDKMVFGGNVRTITNITPIPPEGTVVAYKAWCAA